MSDINICDKLDDTLSDCAKNYENALRDFLNTIATTPNIIPSSNIDMQKVQMITHMLQNINSNCNESDIDQILKAFKKAEKYVRFIDKIIQKMEPAENIIVNKAREVAIMHSNAFLALLLRTNEDIQVTPDNDNSDETEGNNDDNQELSTNLDADPDSDDSNDNEDQNTDDSNNAEESDDSNSEEEETEDKNTDESENDSEDNE